MARRSFEDKAAQLKLLSNGPLTPDSIRELRTILGGTDAHFIAKAAEIAGRLECQTLVPELLTALQRLFQKPANADPSCCAKLALVEALEQLQCEDEAPFWLGVRFQQWEPVFGGKADTAGPVRAACATTLGRIGRAEEVIRVLAELLLDHDPSVRGAAARNLGRRDSLASELVLQFKVSVGDEDPSVIEDCLAALLSLAPDRYYPYCAEKLKSTAPQLAQAAALALALSRDRNRSVRLLLDHYAELVRAEARDALLVPIAMTRASAAFPFLLDLVEEGHPTQAALAVRALSYASASAEEVATLQRAVEARRQPALSREFAEHFKSAR